jgi:hypothetical protein
MRYTLDHVKSFFVLSDNRGLDVTPDRRIEMAIDIKALESEIESVDARKRKLEKLRTLLADEDTRLLMSDPEIMGLIGANATKNEHSIGTRQRGETPQTDDDNLPEEGSLRRLVLDTAIGAGKFSVRDIYERMKRNGHKFAAKKPTISINAAVAYLIEKDLIDLVSRSNGQQPAIYEARKDIKNKKTSE